MCWALGNLRAGRELLILRQKAPNQVSLWCYQWDLPYTVSVTGFFVWGQEEPRASSSLELHSDTWPLRTTENSGPPVCSATSFQAVAPGSSTGHREKPTRPTFPFWAIESLQFVGSCVPHKAFGLSFDIKAVGDTCSWSYLGLMAPWSSGHGTWTGVGSRFPQADEPE